MPPPPPSPPPRLKRRFGLEEHITAHRVRHILVTYVQQRHKAADSVLDSIAYGMGHALRMWNVRMYGWHLGWACLPEWCAVVATFQPPSPGTL